MLKLEIYFQLGWTFRYLGSWWNPNEYIPWRHAKCLFSLDVHRPLRKESQAVFVFTNGEQKIIQKWRMWGFFGSPKLDLWPEASGLKSRFFRMITGLKFWRRSAFEKTSLSMGLMSFFPKFWRKERPILAQICGPKDLSASRIYTILLGILHWGSTCTKRQKNSPVVYVVGVIGGDLPKVRHMM